MNQDSKQLFSNIKAIDSNFTIILIDDVDSTQSKARELIDNNVQVPLVVISKTQSNGHGWFNATREKNVWYSDDAGNLYMSLALHINDAKITAYALKYYMIYCVCKCLEKYNVTIKWPNDLFCNSKKIGGMLMDTIRQKDNDRSISVIGFGLNINGNTNNYPDNIKNIASSLSKEHNKLLPFDDITVDIIKALYNLTTTDSISPSQLAEDWNKNNYLIGKTVKIKTLKGQEYTGIVKGVNNGFELIINTEEGEYILPDFNYTYLKIIQ